MSSWGKFLYSQGACSRGYKLWSGEGPGPKSSGGGERAVLLSLMVCLSYGHPWAHYSGQYQDRLLGGPLGLLDLGCTTPAGVKSKDYRGIVLG
jgi:hypothetical protein